jgi:hypothetical protein
MSLAKGKRDEDAQSNEDRTRGRRVLWAHMIHLQLTIGPFEVAAATALVVVTFVSGWVIGCVFAIIWNWFSSSGMTSVRAGVPGLLPRCRREREERG